jgi:hypothetical protein
MSSDSSLFAAAIAEHLELKRRNRALDADMPLEEFLGDDPFSNHPLFKSEADALREEEETGDHPQLPHESAADTAEMPAVAPAAEPHAWMDTARASDFTWE